MELRFFNGGYCRQLLALVDRRSWRWVKFQAVFFAVRHPAEGWVLVDTGYGDRFPAATRDWPYRLYRLATPATMAGTTSAILQGSGIDPTQIRHVIITHFHADHIGGLAEFPRARIHYHADAWQPLVGLSPYRQVRAAFLPSLVPANFVQQSHPLAPAEFAPARDFPFRVHDLFRDGLIRLVDLPGHAPGHLGVMLATGDGPLLYATDAYWAAAQIQGGVDLITPVQRLQWDPPAYQRTVTQLREVARAGRHRILSCHALETQARVENRGSIK